MPTSAEVPPESDRCRSELLERRADPAAAGSQVSAGRAVTANRNANRSYDRALFVPGDLIQSLHPVRFIHHQPVKVVADLVEESQGREPEPCLIGTEARDPCVHLVALL